MTTLCRNVRELDRPWRVFPSGGCWGEEEQAFALHIADLQPLEQMVQTLQFSRGEEDSGIFLALSGPWSGTWSS